MAEAEAAVHAGLAEGGGDPGASLAAAAYALSLAAFLEADPEAPRGIREGARELREAASARPGEGREALFPSPAELRALNALRHRLARESGQAPADWDLLDPRNGKPDPGARRVRQGLRIYLEDIRSPFNVGSMLRTADAFGVEEVLLSPETADPGHPRAARSSMGASSLVPWRRAGLEALAEAKAEGLEVFGLELGGYALGEFPFPRKGLALLGSEELGLSSQALELCEGRVVSIPMAGAKASLNVGVALGILLQAWTSTLS
jgi:TrmH family RNA methyltransferase